MKKVMWVLLDDRMGSVGQAKGIILALADKLTIIEKQIVYNKWAKLPNCLKGRSLIGVDINKSSELNKDYPDLVLSTSRRTTPIARLIKKESKNKTKIIQLMHPGKCGIKDLDLVIIPEHDAKKCKGNNFFMITGCPHRITDSSINEAALKWEKEFFNLPKPYLSVIIGGAIKGKPFSLENAKSLAERIKSIHKEIGGSILVTTSRRTGTEPEKLIMDTLKGIPMHTFLWGEKKENPYMGYLACADKIIITGDSVSMCSEACGTGKPVLVFEGSNWLTSKHHRFVESLYDGKFAIAIDNPKALDFYPEQKLNCATAIATKILEIR